MPEAIDIAVGGWFKVVLRKSGGTNYAWCLSGIPKGVVLAGCDSECVGSYPGAAEDQTFYFLVTKRPDDLQLAFQMVCLSEPGKAPSEEVIIQLSIVGDEDGNPLGAGKFVQYGDNAAFVEATQKYGFPWAQSGRGGGEKYGYPCASILKYGYPDEPVLKYGYPGCVDPTAVKYGYPGCADLAAFKYGYPGCVDPTAVKYGYPGCADLAAFKYGYPGCVDPTAVKYGYPGCADLAAFKYGYPGCVDPAVVKYGYPGCMA